MNSLRFAPAFAAALVLAGSTAFAANGFPPGFKPPPPSSIHDGDSKNSAKAEKTSVECNALQVRFDGAIKTHAAYPAAAQAKMLRQLGGQLCASGETADGIAKLDLALNEIGVKGEKAGD